MNSLEQLRGLALGFALLVAISAVLLQVLARTVPAVPGPRWWARGCLLALPGLALAGFALSGAAVPWQRGLGVLGELLLLLALGCIAEGLLRFGGRRSARRWMAGAALLYLPGALAGWAWADASGQSAIASLALALAWTGIVAVALAQVRRGPGVILVGIAACAGVAAAGAALRVQALWQAELAGVERLLRADALMLWAAFLACGLLVLLLVLAVSFRLLEQLRREAVRDPLTGALNRRGFEQHTARLAALSARLGQSVVVLMLDIDHFRQLNERHGTAVGDMALKSLAQLVQRAKRESDAFARLGGEEFCIVLPGTDVPGARVFADRLRRSYEAFEIDTGSSFVSCTVSIGVAYASAAALQAGGVDLVDLLRQADEALYEAKRAGRNRVRFFASAEVMSSRLDSRLFTSTIPNAEP